MGYSWGNVFQLPRLLVSWHISDCHSFWVQRRSKKLWKKKPRKNPKSLLWLTVLLAGYQTRWSPEVPSIPRDSVTVILQILCSEYTYVQISFLNKYFFFSVEETVIVYLMKLIPLFTTCCFLCFQEKTWVQTFLFKKRRRKYRTWEI